LHHAKHTSHVFFSPLGKWVLIVLAARFKILGFMSLYYASISICLNPQETLAKANKFMTGASGMAKSTCKGNTISFVRQRKRKLQRQRIPWRLNNF